MFANSRRGPAHRRGLVLVSCDEKAWILESLTLAAFCETFPYGRHNSSSFPTPAYSHLSPRVLLTLGEVVKETASVA